MNKSNAVGSKLHDIHRAVSNGGDIPSGSKRGN